MKLDQLSYFLEAAKFEHIGKASKALAISPSAISHSIAALEEELGRNLFEKKGKRIQLTDHGKLLAEKARRLLEDVELVREEIASNDVQLRGHYKIAGTHWLCVEYLTPAWIGIQNRNPKLSVEIYTLRSAQVIHGVTSGEYDFGLCFNPQSHPEMEFRILKKGGLVVVYREGHPLQKFSAAKQLAQLENFPAVLPKGFQGVEVCESHPVFAKFGVKPKASCLVDSYDLAAQCVRHSEAWGFFPEVLVEPFGLKVMPTPTGWEANYLICAVWPRGRFVSEPIKQLLASLAIS